VTTILAFQTPPGGVSIPVASGWKELGVVDVHTFRQIRLVADERTLSAPVVIRLWFTEGNELLPTGGARPAQPRYGGVYLDTVTLQQTTLVELLSTVEAQVTRVYDVPGTTLTVFAFAGAEGVSGGGEPEPLTAVVDVLIYGSD
jgi:hypothetical protein